MLNVCPYNCIVGIIALFVMADVDIDAEELRANLAEYKEQQRQLEELLLDENGNEDYQALYDEVQEAIELTEAALAEHGAALQQADGAVGRKRKSRFEPAEAGAPSTSAGAALPAKVLAQIAAAKARSALEGRGPLAWAIGGQCQARYSDGQWYPATILEVVADEQYVVQWDGWNGTTERVHISDAKPRDASSYRGATGSVRKAIGQVSKEAVERFAKGEDVTVMPKWMEINETDSEKAKEKKKRAIKAWKKKAKFQRQDLESEKKATDWKSFITGKGKKKKTGFLTGSKKESMFAVPDNPRAKVGVIGSGQGMTNAPTKRTRLDF